MTKDLSHKSHQADRTGPEIAQRELSQQPGASLGKVKDCLHALIDKGWVKARNFKYSQNKLAPSCLFTPQMLHQKTVVAATEGIVRILSAGELEGVMAHELAHVQNHDKLISTIAATFAGTVSMLGSMLQGLPSLAPVTGDDLAGDKR